jgi:hypothetical protein
MSKFAKLYALARKAHKATATLTRKFEGEGSTSLRFGAMPAAFTADSFAELAERTGARVVVVADVGASVGKGGGELSPMAAAQFVRELVSDEAEEPTPARKPANRITRPSANGTHEPAPTA